MERRSACVLCSLLMLGLLAPMASADVKLPAVFTDNMVLQQGHRLPVWGWADAKEKVTVTLAGQAASTWADDEGEWSLRLGAMGAGGPHEVTVQGNNTLTLTNVMVGEVWVCSGQSNMQWTVGNSNNAQAEIAAANYPNIRLFTVKRRPSSTPESDTEGSWVTCTPETVPGFTAVGYFFGRDLHKELGVPIGLINTSWGGTRCEAWTSTPGLSRDPELQPIFDSWAKAEELYPEQQKDYEAKRAEWQKAVEKAKAEGTPAPRGPGAPLFAQKQHAPAGLYNGMIQPLIPYAIRGAIWYQGESNAGRAYQYRNLFPTMIRDWRENWGQGAFPFYFVQLANFMAVKPDPAESAWAELREAQSMTLSLKNTGQAVIIDIGEATDIHPRNKQDVGKRLALNALAETYGREIVYYGPEFVFQRIEEDSIRLFLDHLGGGLVAKDGPELAGFAIAGRDRQWVWANARIERDTVVVSSPQISRPVAVRYAWADNPVCNLYNQAGLPAQPFRTDDWPGVTINNK